MARTSRALVLSLVASVVGVSAQQAPPLPERASFELTSVKRNNSGAGRGSNRNQPNGSTRTSNYRKNTNTLNTTNTRRTP